jgi:hypothetical protein
MAAVINVSSFALRSTPTVTVEEALERVLTEKALGRVLMENPRKDNPKQPSDYQMSLLSAFQVEGVLPRFATMSKKDWVMWMDPFNALFYDGNEELFSEMMMRATKLVDLVVEHKETKNVVFMDGHGRFTWCFLKVLSDRDLLDTYHIHIVDVDETVCHFHKAFFPSGIHILHENVFSIERHSRIVYYLNFCGTAGMRDNIVEFVKAQRTTWAPLLLSYFVGRGAELGCMKNALGRLGREKYAPRDTFPTYAFSDRITKDHLAKRKARRVERACRSIERINRERARKIAEDEGDLRRSRRDGRGTKRGRG